MSAPDYELIVADLLTDEIRDAIPITSVTYTREIGGSGGWNASAPLRSGLNPEPITTANLDTRARSSVYVLRDGQVLYGGILWTAKASASAEGGQLDIGGKGHWSYYEDCRTIRSDKVYSAATDDQFHIVADLIAHASSFASGDIGVVVERTPFDSGVKRDRTYLATDRKPIGEAISQLSEVIGGFDFELVAGGERDAFTKTLRLATPRLGVHLDASWESGKNIDVIDFDADGTTYGNLAIAVGEDKTSIFQRSGHIGTHALVERVRSYTTVKEQATLDGHARSDLARTSDGGRTMQVRVRDVTDSMLGTFDPGDDVLLIGAGGLENVVVLGTTDTGDVAALGGATGGGGEFSAASSDESAPGSGLVSPEELGFDIPTGLWRIMRITVTITENAVESILCDLAPLDAFYFPMGARIVRDRNPISIAIGDRERRLRELETKLNG